MSRRTMFSVKSNETSFYQHPLAIEIDKRVKEKYVEEKISAKVLLSSIHILSQVGRDLTQSVQRKIRLV